MFILRFYLKLDYSEICNIFLKKISASKFPEIYDAVIDTDIEIPLHAEKSWGDFFYSKVLNGSCIINYVRDSGEQVDFIEDLLLILHDENKFDLEIIEWARFYFDDDTKPIKYLLWGAIHVIDDAGHNAETWVGDFFKSGQKLLTEKLYNESLICFKNAFFHAAFMSDEKIPSCLLDFIPFAAVTRKLSCYGDSIKFLSTFRILYELGLPIQQPYLNEIEITIRELEGEFERKQYHKIDEFYELVAKEDFPAVQSHVSALKGQGKFVLTRDQMQVLINKIQEKSDIILGIKSISAKCDMLMYMHREVYDKQAAILDAIKDNREVFEEIINRNTEKIIETTHKRNENFERQINLKTCQGFYNDQIGSTLWDSLDENTRKYLLLAKHLDTANQYSLSDEYGFIAIEFALAIENEFKAKLIDPYLSYAEQINFKTSDGMKAITADSKITMGVICMLMDRGRKIKNTTDLLWPFFSFVEDNAAGGRKIFDFKNALFDIKDKYRNPAAHPSNYSRHMLDSFKELLFQKGFMKDYLEAIQQKKNLSVNSGQ